MATKATRTQPVTSKLRNAAACAVIAESQTKDAPTTLADWNRRQINLTQSIARTLGMSYADVLPAVAEVFPKVYGRSYLPQ